uniref:CSON004233 protein n=1 Tax=Culicoides sonorensis TaxID=179676 RepID=A0A336N147_CULSO
MGKFKKIPAKQTATVKSKSSVALKSTTTFKAPKDASKGIHRSIKLQEEKPVKGEKAIGVNEFADFSIKKSDSVKKVVKGKKLTKKQKQQFRKEKILERIQATQNAFVEDKARAKREKTEIIKDVKPLLDALPSLDSIFQFKSDKIKTGVPDYDKPPKKSELKKARREQNHRDFVEKLQSHKALVQNFSNMTSEQRREAIREAARRKREALNNNDGVGEKMEN